MKIKEKLISLLKDWNSIEGIKPVNDKDIIESFIKFFWPDDEKEFVDMWITFEGDGSYFGKQISMEEDNRWEMKPDDLLSLEISHSQDKISVYTGNHHGFWTPEYIKLKRGDPYFLQLRESLYKRIADFTGLPLNFSIAI